MKTNVNKVKSEDPASYDAGKTEAIAAHEAEVIAAAIRIIESRQREPGQAIESPNATREYLYLQLAEERAEVFCALFLDNRHRVIELRRMFTGTIDGASVHPREVVRAAIELNAAALILAHNHPSGVSEPSRADIQLTRRLTDALALVDVRILDHIVIGDTAAGCASFAERGLI